MEERAGERSKKYAEHGGKPEHWIGKMHLKKNALRDELHVKAGEKIPAKKLAAAAKKSGIEGKRAKLAETFRGFGHGK